VANPPTVADLEGQVAARCAVPLADAGVYLTGASDAGAAITPAIREGIRRGVARVGMLLADPSAPSDAEVGALSSFALERVRDEAERFALRRALGYRHRSLQAHVEPLEPGRMDGGWLAEEWRAVRERVLELDRDCAGEYREPGDSLEVGGGPGDYIPFGGRC
jgi:uncharacterized protein (DUF2126 family)